MDDAVGTLDPLDVSDMLRSRMADAPDTITVNGATFQDALLATTWRAESPVVTGQLVEPMPPLD